jgi:hypothetical protein
MHLVYSIVKVRDHGRTEKKVPPRVSSYDCEPNAVSRDKQILGFYVL